MLYWFIEANRDKKKGNQSVFMQTHVDIFGSDAWGAQLRGRMSLVTNETLIRIEAHPLDSDTFI